jgi:hypothetical protein
MFLASIAQRERLIKSILFTILAMLLFAVSVKAQTLTFSGRQIQTGGQYQLTADFNNDGRADVATAGLDVEILLGKGDGTFLPNKKYAVGTSLTGITTADFNNDAKLDIAVSLNDTVEVGVLLGNGDGTFQSVNRFTTGATGSPTSVVAADFNLDGRADLLTSDPIYCRTAPCFLTKTATIFLGNGDGTFQTPRQFDTVTPVQQFRLGDFNRDGITDAVGAASFGKVLILLSNGDGTFRQMPDVLIVQNVDNTDVAVGDYNGDQVLDLVAAADGESKFGVVLGNGDGTFKPVSVITDTLMQRGWRLVPADFNRDGRLDVGIGFGFCCSGGTTLGAFGVMLGNGNGTFGTISRHIRPGNGRIQLATIDPVVADFNGDGKPDVAAMFYNNVGGTTRGTIILTNTSGVSPRSPALGTLSVEPTSVLGGTVAEVNIPLVAGAVAPSGGLTFTASNTNPSVAFLPFSQTSPPMIMAAGMTNLRFKVETKPVTTTQTVTVTVRHSSLGSRSVNLTVTPPSEPLALASLKVSSGIYGGNDAGGEVTLAAGHVAPAGGVTVLLTNDNPNLITSMPSSVTIPAGQSNASFTIQTWTTGTTTPVNFTASHGAVTRSAVMNVHAPSQAIPISAVTLSQPSIVGGSNQAVQATITLAANAPNEGATIMLSSSRPDIVSLPRSVRIFFSTQNTTFVNFIANPVSTPTEVTITAYFGDSVRSAVVTVTPAAANTPALSSLTLTPASVTGGSTSQGRVTISAAASSPTTITLSRSGSTAVTVPASVTIPAGATAANFTVNTSSVSSSVTATIGAALNGVSRSATLTVTPPAPPPPPPSADTVGIQVAEYSSGNRQLRVEASSTNSSATLNVYVTSTNVLIGTLRNEGGGRYRGDLSWSSNPQSITVRSNFGGSASRTVVVK